MNEDLVGTYHVPAGGGCDQTAASTGVLFINPGPAPRTGNSDLSVFIADRLAAKGVPVYRFDLPGLGDSTGTTPTTIDDYWRDVLRGRNDEVTYELTRELRRQTGLTNLIIGGLCAAAVPILRAPNHGKNGISGMILLEPNFRLESEQPAAAKAIAGGPSQNGTSATLRRVVSPREWKRVLTKEGPIARFVLPLRRLVRRVRHRSMGQSMPKDANLPLIDRWRESLAGGVHSLVIVADGDDLGPYVSRVMNAVRLEGPGAVTLVPVPQTNHILTSGAAREVVVAAVERWVASNFAGTGTTASTGVVAAAG